jgi:transcriptional regulator with XRE-family HTH domain
MNKGQWLDKLLDEMGWTSADLSRATGLDSAVISNIRNGKRGTGFDTALKIARAMKRPPEQIYRAAGLLPAAINIDEEMEQIIHEIEKLPKADREEILAFIRMKNNLRKKK